MSDGAAAIFTQLKIMPLLLLFKQDLPEFLPGRENLFSNTGNILLELLSGQMEKDQILLLMMEEMLL